jgi:hypothetical protein
MSQPAPGMNNSAFRSRAFAGITTGISANTLPLTNPYYRAALRRSRYQTAFNLGLLTGAYAQMRYGYYPGYGMMYPMYGGGYGSMTSSGYGSGMSNSYQARPNNSASSEPYIYVSPYDLSPSSQGNALAGLRKYGGGLSWPIGLRSVSPKEETSDLLKRIDSAAEALLQQPEADRALGALRDLKRLKKRYDYWVVDAGLSSAQRADARRFLDKVEDALMSVGNSQAAPKSGDGDKPGRRY